MTNNQEHLQLKHYVGKLNYELYSLIHKKIKMKGVPVTLLLTLSSITALTKQFLPHINPIYTCCASVLTYTITYLWSFIHTQQYYNIKLVNYGVNKNNKYMKFYSKYKDKYDNKVFRFKSNIPLSFLKSNVELIEMVLKTNVIEIKQSNNKSIFEIITNKKPINYKDMAKNAESKGARIYAAFTKLGLNINNINEKKEEYKNIITFDSNETKKNIEKNIGEIEHLTGLQNISLYSNDKTDFKIVLNKSIGVVSFGNLLLNSQLNTSNNMVIGITEDNNLHTLDIKKLYHSIIAGSTGFGKSNLSHVLLSSLLKSDIDASFFLLDPKKSELKRYRDINRVLYSGDHEEIINILRSLVKEMDRRNKLIESDKFVNNLETWNSKYKEQLGYIIVYIEEIADLMCSSDKEYVEEFQKLITRLSQLGRSTGIRLFLSTQYPKKEVLPTLIKNNCINRFGFAVSNKIESGVIVDCNILTELNNIGEMYFKHNGRFTKIKVPYLEDEHIVSLITYLEERHNKTAQYPLGEAFVSIVSNEAIAGVEAYHYCNESDTATQQVINKEPIVMSDLTEVITKEDLLKFYLTNCENEVFSVNKTVDMVTIGRTKLQQLRKDLINNGSLEVLNGKTYINNREKLKRIK